MNQTMQRFEGPHQSQEIVSAGEELAQAKAAGVLMRGKGGGPQSILFITNEFNLPEVAYLAPQGFRQCMVPEQLYGCSEPQ